MKLKALVIVLLLVLLPATAADQLKCRLRPPLWQDQDHRNIPEPKEQEVSELFGILYNSWFRHLSPEHHALAARDPGALNVNAWDEVPDSTWFTNRIGRNPLSYEQILTGLEGEGPAPGPWQVLGNIDEGYTPKLYIKDGAGRTYVLKFDLPTALERNSGAERIGTLILYACGYNVPHNSIAYFTPDNLFFTEDSYYQDAVGKRRRMAQGDLDDTLEKLKPLADGRYRGLASLYLSGTPLGKFLYTGIRKDDPNDIIPHELRRELRGFYVIASWINHADVGDKNTIDMFVTDPDGRKYVKHYLIDFGSIMGSGNFFNGPFRVGHEYLFDGSTMGHSFITLGKWRRPWEARGKIEHTEVGYFQAEVFEPNKWKANYPNLAFERMNDDDAYWGAKIVTAFSDQLILEIARAAEYSLPEVTEYITNVLKRRRDAIGKYWLDKITPLESFELRQIGSEYSLHFRDLATERGYADSGSRSYRFWLEGKAAKEFRGMSIDNLDLSEFNSPKNSLSPDNFGRTVICHMRIESNQRAGGWALPVEVILGKNRDSNSISVLGWQHAVRSK